MLSNHNSEKQLSLWKKVPNLLTLLRLLLVPLFVFLLVKPTPNSSFWACVLFVFASFTDWLDGYIARLYQSETTVGKLLDPLADKILVTAALIMLVANPQEPRVPAWIVVLLLSRDLLITGLRSLAALQGTIVAAGTLAKHKTAWTMIAIFCLLLREQYKIFGIEVNFFYLGMLGLWIALVLSLISGLGYAIRLRKMFWETE